MTLAPLRSVSLILAAVFLAAAAQAHDHDHDHAKAQPDAKAQGASAPLDAHARADMERHRATKPPRSAWPPGATTSNAKSNCRPIARAWRWASSAACAMRIECGPARRVAP